MNRFLIHVISMVFAVASIPHVAAIEPTVPNNLPKEAWANALLDQILSPEKSPFYAEGPPSREWETKQLIALGDAGWEQTYRRLENGHFHTAIADVLGSRRLAFRETEQAKTERILNLLKAKDFKVRQWIPQIIKRREPTNGNRLLREFLSDADTELREALLIAFNPKNATAEDVEKVIGFLDDPSPNVRFRANDFLERATGHLFVREGKSENTKAEWTEWWVQQKPADIDTILKRELTRDANLLVNSDEKIRETAGIVLIAHSCQIYFGFHQKNMWWGCMMEKVRGIVGWNGWIFDMTRKNREPSQRGNTRFKCIILIFHLMRFGRPFP